MAKKEVGKNLDEQLKEKEKVYVLFHANWCPFCRAFMPAFEEYARANPKGCLSVEIGERPDLFEKYSVEYYPTVILLEKGKVKKRLDAKPGVGLDKKQLDKLVGKS